MASTNEEGSIYLSVLEKGQMTPTTPSQNPLAEASPSSSTAPKKKYVNDTSLHLAAQQGDLLAVKKILDDIDSQMVVNELGLFGGEDDESFSQMAMTSVVNEVNELGETALFTAAERGHLEVLKELLKYSNRESITKKNRSGFDALHIAVIQGHHAIVQVLLYHDPCLLGISNFNGKNALHLAARRGHVDVVRALLDIDPQLAWRTDKKGQTALHKAVKGVSLEVVVLLVEVAVGIVRLPDKFGYTALHVATWENRAEVVRYLLGLPDTNVNALTIAHKTALDIAEALPLSQESFKIKKYLNRSGAIRATELAVEVKKSMKDLHTQLEQTYNNVYGIATELRKPHREGNNDVITMVATLLATVTFSAMFSMPGGDNNDGMAVVVSRAAFMFFFICNAIAFFASVAVVVIQITLVRSKTIAERRVAEIINKLLLLAFVCTFVAFMAGSYIVVGCRHEWTAVFVTVVGGVIMAGVLGTRTYHVLKSKRVGPMEVEPTSLPSSLKFDDSEVDSSYALLSSDILNSPTLEVDRKKHPSEF